MYAGKIINLFGGYLPIKLMVLMLEGNYGTHGLCQAAQGDAFDTSWLLQYFSGSGESLRYCLLRVFWPQGRVYSAASGVSVRNREYAGRITDYPFLKDHLCHLYITA